MADFCKQCSIDMFGEDTKDHANLCPSETGPYYVAVICEGCGYTYVDETGTCCLYDCLEKHGIDMEYNSWLGEMNSMTYSNTTI